MGVEVLGNGSEVDGHGDSMEAFRNGNNSNANMLLNVTEGKKKTAPRAVYDPRHPDNEWPKMLHHPEKGGVVFGLSLLGVKDPAERKRIVRDNEEAVSMALKAGFRPEPYMKPQIAVLDPAVEKAEMLRKNQEMEGRITALTDLVMKLTQAKSA